MASQSMKWSGCRAAIVASAALLLAPEAANAAPADMALMKSAQRVPDLQAQLPPQAIENSAVVGQLTPGLMAASSIAVTLGDGSKLVAKRQRDVSGPMGSKSWVGEFADSPGSSFVLTEHKGSMSGFFNVGDGTYEIVPSRSRAGSHLVYRIDESRLPRMSEPAVVEEGNLIGDGDVVEASGNGVVIDLMIVYTQATRAKYGQAGIESKILSAVASSNQALANSAIDASFNLVYMGEVNYTETGDMTQALAALQGTSDGKMDEVHKLRDQYGADMVQLINEDSNWCGYANIMRSVSTSFAPYAFSVVRSSCISNLSVQHELGHNFGNHHDRDSTSSTGAYAYSYGFRRCMADGTGFRTVMSYPCSGASRINHFSNPDQTYNGYPLGVAYETSAGQSADNGRSMRNTMSTVASFRGGSTTLATVPSAPGGVTAAAASDRQVDITWSDNSNDESGFRIERSTNGVDWSEVANVAANTRSYSSTGLAASTWYYFRVRAWNSAGNSGYSNVASARTDAAAPPPPAAPTAMTAATAGSEVQVAWADMSSNESGFHVLREKFNNRKGTWGSAVTMTVGANLTSLVDSPGSGTFRYSVQSFNAGGNSAWAGPASANVAGTTKGGNGKGGNGKGGQKGGR